MPEDSDPKMWLEALIATLPHGKNFEGVLLVARGSHMISFFKSGSRAVRGTCSFKVEKDATRRPWDHEVREWGCL